MAFSDKNDFAGFGGEETPAKEKKKKSFLPALSTKTLLIAAAALIVVIAAVLVIVGVSLAGNDLKFKENAFIAFESDGIYYVAYNGKMLPTTFDNPVELTESTDRSFAYVTEEAAEGGFNVYLVKNGKITGMLNEPAEHILCLAGYTPAVVYEHDGGVYLKTQKTEERIANTKKDTVDHFIISDDAAAVAYTKADDEEIGKLHLYVHRNGVSEKKGTNVIPLLISSKGTYVYAYGLGSDAVTKTLVLINAVKADTVMIPIADGFYSINAVNVKGDEIVFTTADATSIRSFILEANKVKAEDSVERATHAIGGGQFVPMFNDPKTARATHLRDMVFENIYVSSKSATYFVSKSYEATQLASYNGKLDKDGKIFYYINEKGTLYSVAVGSTANKASVAVDVVDFAITAKGNLYYLDDSDRLTFNKVSSGKKTTVADDVTDMEFNLYDNVLYFTMDEDAATYLTEEGSTRKKVSFAKTEIASVPVFVPNGFKKVYAFVYDEAADTYDIYYASNGASFKDRVNTGCTFDN